VPPIWETARTGITHIYEMLKHRAALSRFAQSPADRQSHSSDIGTQPVFGDGALATLIRCIIVVPGGATSLRMAKVQAAFAGRLPTSCIAAFIQSASWGTVMNQQQPRLDPEMAAFLAGSAADAAKYPPIKMELPYEPHRRTVELLGATVALGGPVMAETTDHWLMARGRRILCRVYRPRVDEELPLMVHFHGGGWVQNSIDTHDRLAREYAAAGEVSVVSVDFSLSPEAKFPQALEECAAVVRHVGEHGSEWKVDSRRILLGGDSAGGNLALAVALLLRDTGGPAIRGIFASYPVCDSRLDTPSYQSFGAGGYGLTLEQMRFVWTHYVRDEIDRLHPLASPLRADLSGLPPVLLVLPEMDVLRSEGEALARKLTSAGVTVQTEVIEGVVHGFLRACGTVRKARDALGLIGEWLRKMR
jgi:acetyl esterase